MNFSGIRLIASDNYTSFCKEIANAVEDKQENEYRLNYSFAYHPNGSATYSALIEYFTPK